MNQWHLEFHASLALRPMIYKWRIIGWSTFDRKNPVRNAFARNSWMFFQPVRNGPVQPLHLEITSKPLLGWSMGISSLFRITFHLHTQIGIFLRFGIAWFRLWNAVNTDAKIVVICFKPGLSSYSDTKDTKLAFLRKPGVGRTWLGSYLERNTE